MPNFLIDLGHRKKRGRDRICAAFRFRENVNADWVSVTGRTICEQPDIRILEPRDKDAGVQIGPQVWLGRHSRMLLMYSSVLIPSVISGCDPASSCVVGKTSAPSNRISSTRSRVGSPFTFG